MCGTDNTTTGLTLTDKNACACCGPTSHTETSHTETSHAETSAGQAETGHPAVGHPASSHIDHFLVSGMTCGHCVSSVTEELSEIDGVLSVTVDLNVGGVSRVMVASDAPVDSATIRAAVAEAGYELVDSPA